MSSSSCCSYDGEALAGFVLTRRACHQAWEADADLVILDMDHEEILHAEDSHYMCGWMSAEDLPSQGRPRMTILRGSVIMEDGNVTAEKGSGRLLRPGR